MTREEYTLTQNSITYFFDRDATDSTLDLGGLASTSASDFFHLKELHQGLINFRGISNVKFIHLNLFVHTSPTKSPNNFGWLLSLQE
jgi:hypothetical protein